MIIRCNITKNYSFFSLVVFNVPSTVMSFRDGTPIYCPTGNRTLGRRVAVHYTTVAPR